MDTSPAPQPYTASSPTSGLAVAGLVFSIMAWVALPLVGAIVGVVLGHMARGEIRRSARRVEGDGLAVAALIVGYLNIALFVVIGLLFLLLLAGLFSLGALN